MRSPHHREERGCLSRGGRRIGRSRARQQGAVLMVVLVLLGLLLMASASVMRSVDTGNVIAGNYAFRQAAIQASDRAISDAMNYLASTMGSAGGNTAVSNRYLPLRQTSLDSRGMPDSIIWSSVDCADETGASVSSCETAIDKYRVQYVIERLCKAQPDLNDVMSLRANCEYEAEAGAIAPKAVAVRYRVLIRVRGPRNTEEWFESMVSGPAVV
jgi:type IV pilus assembly protein PilX